MIRNTNRIRVSVFMNWEKFIFGMWRESLMDKHNGVPIRGNLYGMCGIRNLAE